MTPLLDWRDRLGLAVAAVASVVMVVTIATGAISGVERSDPRTAAPHGATVTTPASALATAEPGVEPPPTSLGPSAALAAALDPVWSDTPGGCISVVDGDRVLYEANDEATVVPASLTKRSEEHTSELQSLMRISYAVFCLKKK